MPAAALCMLRASRSAASRIDSWGKAAELVAKPRARSAATTCFSSVVRAGLLLQCARKPLMLWRRPALRRYCFCCCCCRSIHQRPE